MNTPGELPLRYVAFLRAINVGGHIVKMERLRALFEEVAYENVETFIASGNVIFNASDEDTEALETRIEEHLKQSLGYEVKTFIRTVSELATVATYQPFDEADILNSGNSLYVAFLPTTPSNEAHERLMKYQNEVDYFHIHEREVYWLCRRSIGISTFAGAALEKALKMPATVRNITTVKRLAAKYCVS